MQKLKYTKREVLNNLFFGYCSAEKLKREGREDEGCEYLAFTEVTAEVFIQMGKISIEEKEEILRRAKEVPIEDMADVILRMIMMER